MTMTLNDRIYRVIFGGSRIAAGLLWLANVHWKRPPVFGKTNGSGLYKYVKYGIDNPTFPPFAWVLRKSVSPNMTVFGWMTLLLEVSLAALLILGWRTRPVALLAAGQSMAIGLSVAQTPNEWPWSYVLMVCLHLMLFATDAGRFGGLDGLHANFAYMADGNPEWGVLNLPLEIYDETQRVNARGFFLCTKAVLPPMIARGGGSIVYTSSAAANAGGPAQVSYAMSKSAGQALMRHVATRYGAQGIRANTLAPALTMHSRLEMLVPPEMIDAARSAARIKSRVGRPDDLAAMGALLLSDDGSYITGQVIAIDGGTTVRP